MVAVRLKGRITQDRRLIVALPDDVPAGDVEVTVEVLGERNYSGDAVERARAKLAAAGALRNIHDLPLDALPPEDDDLIELPDGSPSIDQVIDEGRGVF